MQVTVDLDRFVKENAFFIFRVLRELRLQIK